MNARVYVFPTSALKEDGKKINYFEYISSLKNEDCNSAIMRIVPLIDLNMRGHNYANDVSRSRCGR